MTHTLIAYWLSDARCGLRIAEERNDEEAIVTWRWLVETLKKKLEETT